MPKTGETRPEEIYEAGADDTAAIADIHVASWREVYRSILPDAYLDSGIVEERQRYWADALAAPGNGFVLVARRGGRPSGFIAVARDGEPGYDAFIESLHVVGQMRGSGLGRRLMRKAAERLLAEGATSVCLRVYDANAAAIRFYERLGGQRDGSGIDPFAGADMPDTRFGWRDLAALREACGNNG
jgi:ribosomal protein S18 acetylase RimI-like enzyme